ncbi:hypothetical protein Q671_12755 [Halomonas sp. PBN3]|nr:hypothetical protein Q671_12755 [Halomonas sp. PBN3]
MTRLYKFVQCPLDTLEAGDLLTDIPQFMLGEGAGLLAMSAILQSQQLGNLVQAEAQPLPGFDEGQPRDVGCAIAANTAGRTFGL